MTLYATLGLALLVCQYFNDKILFILSLVLIFNIVGFVEMSIAVGKSLLASTSQEPTIKSQEPNPVSLTEEDYQKENKAYFDLIKTGS